jgi:dUTP pyrophosphatase
MKLLVQKLDERAVLPSRSHHDDAGLDLCALEAVTLAPGERQVVGTGVALAIPSGCVGLIWDKSSIPFKYGVKSMGGVIDAQYRGEVKVILVNLSQETATFEAGQKIAQLLVQKVKLPEVEVVDALPGSVRGEGGFGSTGK